MTRISMKLLIIHNLVNESNWHKRECAEPHCNVSLFLLKEAALALVSQLPDDEKEQGNKLVEEMPKL